MSNGILFDVNSDKIKAESQPVQQQIAADCLTTEGLGDTKPEAKNDTPQGRAENRRVEFVKL